jgi:hypothetical protein
MYDIGYVVYNKSTKRYLADLVYSGSSSYEDQDKIFIFMIEKDAWDRTKEKRLDILKWKVIPVRVPKRRFYKMGKKII